MSTQEWYSVELTEAYANLLKHYLRENDIYFEPSSADNLIHFECLMTEDKRDKVNSFLKLIRDANTR